jgi:hypothetical protein
MELENASKMLKNQQMRGETTTPKRRCQRKTSRDFTEIYQAVYTAHRILSKAELKPYWKSVWGKKAPNNKRTEWV